MSHTAVSQTIGTDLEESPVLSAFRLLCERAPDRAFFTFVDDKGRDAEVVTPRELAFAAEGIARSLRAWGLRAGDRAVLVYPPSMDFVRALVGCLIAGVVAVPAYPPAPVKRDLGGAALAAIVTGSGGACQVFCVNGGSFFLWLRVTEGNLG